MLEEHVEAREILVQQVIHERVAEGFAQHILRIRIRGGVSRRERRQELRRRPLGDLVEGAQRREGDAERTRKLERTHGAC
ncbi:MAG: hypothetical protein K8H88_01145, partial [Sandaracinaceae bacterium]|nr:hypothetical protein [Sandaracinaceae bacterium]